MTVLKSNLLHKPFCGRHSQISSGSVWTSTVCTFRSDSDYNVDCISGGILDASCKLLCLEKFMWLIEPSLPRKYTLRHRAIRYLLWRRKCTFNLCHINDSRGETINFQIVVKHMMT